MAKEQGYCLHKPTGQAYVRFDGKAYYHGIHGIHGTEESKERYNRLKSEWLLNRNAKKFQPNSSTGVCIADICLAYLDHAEVCYRDSTEFVNLKLAIRPLSELYAEIPAIEFGIIQFRACREWWLKRTNRSRSRQYINKKLKRLLRVIKWAVGEGMIPASVYETLRCVPALKKGRTDAPETKPVKPVSREFVEATIKHRTPVVADMVRFQQLVGCRPGELCLITPAMVCWKGDGIVSIEQIETAIEQLEEVRQGIIQLLSCSQTRVRPRG